MSMNTRRRVFPVRDVSAGSVTPDSDEQTSPADQGRRTNRRGMLQAALAATAAAAAGTLLGEAGIPSASAASRVEQGGRIATQWGWFTKAASLNTCLSFARTALANNGFQSARTTGYLVLGWNNTVGVMVVCVPQSGNTWVAVTANSTDSAAAEAARNAVRTTIVNLICFDEC
jgi:hypothetical protein